MSAKHLPFITDVDGGEWYSGNYHGVAGCPRWWSASSEGILVIGEKEVRRTAGKPVTLTRITKKYVKMVIAAGQGDPRRERLLLAIVATESRGNPSAFRREAKLRDASIGICQILTATAKGLGKRAGVTLPSKSLPEGGKLEHWKAALEDPKTSLALCGAYLDATARAFDIDEDPILHYAAYNAGSPRKSETTPWGLVYYRKVEKDGTVTYDAMDTFAAWLGDACAVWP